MRKQGHPEGACASKAFDGVPAQARRFVGILVEQALIAFCMRQVR